MEGSFRDAYAGSKGPNRSPSDAKSNYNTFYGSDRSVQTLMRTSDRLQQTQRSINESEEVAKNVMVDMEMQRGQIQDVRGMLSETSDTTGRVRQLLHLISDRARRQKVCLWGVIILLSLTDLLVFYLLFIH